MAMKEDSLKKEYSLRLHELRVGRDISQQELAKQCGMSFVTLNKIEKAHRFPQPRTRRKLARFFNTDDMLNPLKPVAVASQPGTSSDKLSALRTEIEHFDVIRPAPDVHIFVNPDLPLEQKQIVQELGMELRRRLLGGKRGDK